MNNFNRSIFPRTSSFRLRSQLFVVGLKHALHDGVWALLPVAIAVTGLAFVIWFWTDGPTDVFALLGIAVKLGVLTKIASTLLMGFPTAVICWSSFNNFLLVLHEKSALYRDLDAVAARIKDQDNADERERQRKAEEDYRRARN